MTDDRATVRWIALALAAAALVVVWPFVPVVVLAAWIGVGARRLHRPLTRALGGRRGPAALLTVGAMLLLAVPVALVVASLVADAVDLVERVLRSAQGRKSLEDLVQGGGGRPRSASELASLILAEGGRAWELAARVAGAAAAAVIAAFVLVAGIYAVLVEGDAWYAWIEAHAPVAPSSVRRLADAFLETGRGLLIGIGGAGLLQAIVATIAYLVLGVPQPFALGLLTLAFSVIPAVGTGIVWGPVAIGLALTGRTVEAIALGIVGLGVISTVDNLARPWLARWGRLRLPSFVVLVSMFGGIEVLGGWGVMLGPLAVRLAAEAIDLARAPAE